MRFLVDEWLTSLVAELLTDAGHDAFHVVALGLNGHDDVDMMAWAVSDQRVLISADADFGELLALGDASLPSVILLRRGWNAWLYPYCDCCTSLKTGCSSVASAP